MAKFAIIVAVAAGAAMLLAIPFAANIGGIGTVIGTPQNATRSWNRSVTSFLFDFRQNLLP